MISFPAISPTARAVYITCDMPGCDSVERHQFDQRLLLSQASATAFAQFESSGWKLGTLVPVERPTVISKNHLGDPTAHGNVVGTMVGDICPQCSAGRN